MLFAFGCSFSVDFHGKDAFPKGPVRVDPQEAFAEDDEAGDVLNSIWREIGRASCRERV